MPVSPAAKISVIVPVLNRAKVIGRCLQSIIEQDVPVELIVIDGGSEDGTRDVIEQYREHLGFFESGKDQGISDAFNRGIHSSSGDWIAILNSDDWWEPGAITHVKAQLKVDPRPRILHGSCRLHGQHESYTKLPVLGDMPKYMSIYHSTMFVHRDVYALVGEYRSDYRNAMDAEWVHRALAKNVEFEAIPGVISNMAMGGVSDVNFRQSLAEYRRSVIKHGIASPVVANSYYWLHLAVKVGYRIPGFYPLKRFIDRRINRSVDYDS